MCGPQRGSHRGPLIDVRRTGRGDASFTPQS